MIQINFDKLSPEQQLFCNTALTGQNIRVEACIGSGKTTAIQTLCELFPKNKLILYLTYNKLLKIDAQSKIKNDNCIVTNYHGFVYPYLTRNGINCGISESIRCFTENRLSIPRFDILIIDEYQDIELDFAEMLEYVKSTNPNMQIIMVGDMSQKIYDKTTLDVAKWSEQFLDKHVELEFTRCFRLQPELASMLGKIWNKTIIGVNNDCVVKTMDKHDIADYLKDKAPKDILCLGTRKGAMAEVLNELEECYPDKFNKKTVYASISGTGIGSVNPSNDAAIFTTYDSSKGMEKPICVVFDWDESNWIFRNNRPNSNSEILRNIFCVAASRGKNEIVFVRGFNNHRESPLLTEKTMVPPDRTATLKSTYVSGMFDFKFIEEITRAYDMLEITEIQKPGTSIEINKADELIDLSPCIREYQKAVFFQKYDIDKKLAFMFSQIKHRVPTFENIPMEQKLLTLVSLITNQTRYCNQVRLPFVTPTQHNALLNRLEEKLDASEQTQVTGEMNVHGITVYGTADVIRENEVWSIEFQDTLRPEDFLQATMNSIIFDKPYAMLWNTKNNELYKIAINPNACQTFIDQVYRIITKQKSNTQIIKAKSTTCKHNYYSGCRIQHPRFGHGTILEIKPSLKHSVLVIKFDQFGTKNISQEYVEPV